MAIKFSKVKPGMRLLDIHRHRMGNTTMSEWGCWNVDVITVDATTETAVVSWNGNAPRVYNKRAVERLYTKPTKAYLAQRERRRRGGL